MRGRIKLALTSGTLIAGSAVALLAMQHQAPQVQQSLPVTKANPPFPQAAITAATKPARHPFRAAMASLGLASWYGGSHSGQRTASGEVFNENTLTACHRTLPFGTLVRVINVASGRSVVVRINDRGTMTPNRIIDLSSAAANELGMLEAGVAKVRLEIIEKVQGNSSPHRPL